MDFGDRRQPWTDPDRLGVLVSVDCQVLVCSGMEPGEQLCARHSSCIIMGIQAGPLSVSSSSPLYGKGLSEIPIIR